MAAPGETPTSTQTEPAAAPNQTPEAAVADRILLPAPAVAPPEPPARTPWPLLDYALVLVVLLFACVVAATTARNSDLWLHLATGHALVQGQYHFGVDPFAQDTAGVYWVNTNWLYDLLGYAVFSALGGLAGLGGAALVLLKAVLITALAAVLVRLGWCGRGLWAPAVGAALALLAVSPWLMLHPMIVSYLFLALTLYFLERPHRPSENGESKPVSFAAYRPLLPLFALWVNLDSWFLLGPATVALYLIGQALQTAVGPDRDNAVRKGEVAALGLLLPAGLAACLLSPHHVYALLTPPAQLGLSPASRALQQDPAFQTLLVSPFQSAYPFLRPILGWNAAGSAYYLLALLMALSFALNARGWRWRRALAALALFLLSAVQYRAVPFFAVAAGPLLALNVQEFLARRGGEWARSGEAARWSVAGRISTLLAGLVLLAAAWPGWIHAAPYEPPRLAVETDASLQETAAAINRWRDEGLLGPSGRGFVTSADAANTFAWFCPEERGVLDARHPLFPAAAAADFVRVRKALSAPDDPKTPEEARVDFLTEAFAPENGADPTRLGGSALASLREVMGRRGADHLIIHDNDSQTALAWTERLQQYPQEWPLLRLDGHTAIFGWRDPADPKARDAFEGRSIDLGRMAFHPTDDEKAPATGPGREPAPPDWSDAFTKARAPRSPRTDEAAFYLVRFDQESPRHKLRGEAAWDAALIASAVGTAACAKGSVVAPYEMTQRLQVLTAHPNVPPEQAASYKPTPAEQLAYHFREDYLAQQDDGPPGLLYLAVRAARRAVRDNPDDAQAYLVLGECYRRLAQNTREQVWDPPQKVWNKRPPRFVLFYRVRTAQAAVAYQHALTVNPSLDQARMGLISLFQDMNYQDLVLEQVKELHRRSRDAGRRPGEGAQQFRDRLADLQDLVDKKGKEVTDLLDKFEVKSAGLPAYPKAEMAWSEFGLAGKALSVLLASDVSVFGDKGMALELELLLHTGRFREANEWADPVKARDYLGATPYLQLRVQMEAAAGDYQKADDDLEELSEEVHAFDVEDNKRVPIRAAGGLAVTQALLLATPEDGHLPYLFRISFFYPEILRQTQRMTGNIALEADYLTLRGLLALESGEMEAARADLGDSLAVWGGEAEARLGGGLDFPARPLAQDALRLLNDADGRQPGKRP